MVFGRMAITLWDPTAGNKPAGVVRTHQDTRVHLPNFERLGGESTRVGEWRVGRLGENYMAYVPLRRVVVEEPRDNGNWTYLRLEGKSGGIVELATIADFKTLAEYAADLRSRHLRFIPEPPAVEVEARDPENGRRVMVRLEFRPERRFIAGVEQSVEQCLDHGLIESPWVHWDKNARIMRVKRNGYRGITYDWRSGTAEDARQ